MDPSPLTRGKLTLTHSLPLPHWLIPAHAGENVHDARLEGDGRGLSPLTRGKLQYYAEFNGARRLIPAHAGKTGRHGPDRQYPWAHPRSRGENGGPARRAFPSGGSSPLTRGKPAQGGRRPEQVRLIPAHAGKTFYTYRCFQIGAAHPRSRGENFRCRHRRYWSAGSSPLTRGKPS